VEREAGDQGQRISRCLRKYGNILRLDDGNLIHAITVGRAQRVDDDFVAALQILQAAEEAVAMARDPDVARRTRLRRAWDVADGTMQRRIVVALLDHRGQVQAGNRNAPHGIELRSGMRLRRCRRSGRSGDISTCVIEGAALALLLHGAVENGPAEVAQTSHASDQKDATEKCAHH
jgi:hypothetical protein